MASESHLSPNVLTTVDPAANRSYASQWWANGRFWLCFASTIVVVRAGLHVKANWASDAGIDHPAGVIIAMAVDVTHGVFYRPLFGPAGYGGTRYFPLYFVLHALLLKLRVPVLFSAYLLSLSAMLLLLVGVFRLLVKLGAKCWLAAAMAGSLLASACAQIAIISPHADGLASALNVWALVMVIDDKLSSRRIALAALLFTLAWSAKMTTAFGVAAAVCWLVMGGRRGKAFTLAIQTLAGYLAVSACMLFFSQGRVVEIFRTCTLGGTNWRRFLWAPLFLVWDALHNDLTVCLLLLFALTALAVELIEEPGRCFRQLPALLFVAGAAVTIGIYGSPGTNINHLLDLQVTATIFLGWMAANSAKVQRRVAVYFMLLAMLVPLGFVLWATAGSRKSDVDRGTQASRLGPVVTLVESSNKPILSENPAIPVLAGQTPYVLDPWMFWLVRRHRPEFGRELLERIRAQAFGFVVLCEDPDTDYGRDWYLTKHFGPGFADILKDHYRLLSVTDGQFVYAPIGSQVFPGGTH